MCFEADFNSLVHNEAMDAKEECVQCPVCATCPGDGPPTIADGFGVPTTDVVAGEARNVFLCEQEDRCVSQAFCSIDGLRSTKVDELPQQSGGMWECSGSLIANSSSGHCLEGHKGPLCAVCEAGYGTHGGDGLCHVCGDLQPGGYGLSIGMVVVVLIVAALVYGLHAYKAKIDATQQDGAGLAAPLSMRGMAENPVAGDYRLSVSFSPRPSMDEEDLNTSSLSMDRKNANKRHYVARILFHPCKIVISFAQVLSALGPVLHIRLPDFMQNLSEYLRTFMFDIRSIVQIDCWGVFDYYGLWCVHIFAVPVVMLLIGELYAYVRAATEDTEDQPDNRGSSSASRDSALTTTSSSFSRSKTKKLEAAESKLVHERRGIRFFMLFLVYP